jgi:two-component SAPR family response regulator
MPLRLLRAIVALGGRGVRDIDIIDALWPDAEGDAGRRVFDTTLHRLRRQLGEDDAVRLTDGRVHLDERICWLDVWALERALVESERLVTQRAPLPELSGIADHLLALYRGPLLAEETVGFANAPRTQLADRFRRVAERLAGALESGGRPHDAQPLFQRAFQANQVS